MTDGRTASRTLDELPLRCSGTRNCLEPRSDEKPGHKELMGGKRMTILAKTIAFVGWQRHERSLRVV
jgi:hypothetical protein